MEVVRRTMDTYNTRDLAAYLDTLSESVRFQSGFSAMDRVYRGHDDLRRYFAELDEVWSRYEMRMRSPPPTRLSLPARTGSAVLPGTRLRSCRRQRTRRSQVPQRSRTAKYTLDRHGRPDRHWSNPEPAARVGDSNVLRRAIVGVARNVPEQMWFTVYVAVPDGVHALAAMPWYYLLGSRPIVKGKSQTASPSAPSAATARIG